MECPPRSVLAPQLQVPKEVPGVPSKLLLPSSTWPDAHAYRTALHALALLFSANFVKLMVENGSSDGHLDTALAAAVSKAGPAL